MRRSKKTYPTERLLDNVYDLLCNDLMPEHREWFQFRNYCGPTYQNAGPYTFKVLTQLEKFYKRVITSRDRSFDEIKKESFEAFKAAQLGFGMPRPLTLRCSRVLFRAQQIVHQILGEFDPYEFAERCTFGKKAAFKLPFRDAYLDKRVQLLSGSKNQLEWFKFCLSEDIHLNRAVRCAINTYAHSEIVAVQAVPKVYNNARIMAPDSVLGGFLSRGLGALIRDRLETATDIKLAKQQTLHRELARQSSLSGYNATLDMSKASDSFVWDHFMALIPSSWHGILRDVRVPRVTIEGGGKPVELKSAMLMGSGHTFPLQTLLFYSLNKAVVELMGSKAKVNVYGDDIIIPSRFATHAITVMEELGFRINVDKSFTEGPFRESCGGDYHTGVDVRPFMVEHVCCNADMNEYTALIHKVANGLLERWQYVEIRQTYDYLMAELLRIQKVIRVVPENETVESGIKYVPPHLVSLAQMPWLVNSMLDYFKLVRVPKKRKPKAERAYYWYSLLPHRAKQLHEYDEGDSEPILNKKGLESKKGSHRLRWSPNLRDHAKS